MLSRQQLQDRADSSGFALESYEKVYTLVGLLEGLRAHPFLSNRLALKGGTALNLFVLPTPRLSVDIDVNYVGSADRETMLADRPRVDQALEQVFGRAGLTAKKVPTEHAGGKWRLAYTSALGRPGTIEVDVNFILRTPLWPIEHRDSPAIGGRSAKAIALLDVHELAAGKLAALMARKASRDLFDVRELLRLGTLDADRLRLGFVVYGGINRVDWRTLSVDKVTTTVTDVESQLVAMLRSDVRPSRSELATWTSTLVRETRELLSIVLPLKPQELEFLDRLNGAGDIVPSLLTGDSAMQATIGSHPGLLWKAQNVRQHIGETPAS